MTTSKITRNFQVTLPVSIRKKFHLKVGAILDFIEKHGMIVVVPKKLVDEDQSWFWSKEWQKHEKEVDASVKKSESTSFKNVREMRKHFAR